MPVAPLTGLPGDYGDRHEPPCGVRQDRQRSAGPAPRPAWCRPTSCSRSGSRGTPRAWLRCSTPPTPPRSVRCGPPDRPTRGWWACSASRSTPPRAPTPPSSTSFTSRARSTSVTTSAVGASCGSRAGRLPTTCSPRLDALYAKAPERTPPPKPVFVYRSAGEAPPASVARPASEVVLSFGGPPISRFVWDPPSRSVAPLPRRRPSRRQRRRPDRPPNVVVMEIPYEFNGSTGNSQPHGVVVGEGRALVFTAAR